VGRFVPALVGALLLPSTLGAPLMLGAIVAPVAGRAVYS
jgi:hypothetical protein